MHWKELKTCGWEFGGGAIFIFGTQIFFINSLVCPSVCDHWTQRKDMDLLVTVRLWPLDAEKRHGPFGYSPSVTTGRCLSVHGPFGYSPSVTTGRCLSVQVLKSRSRFWNRGPADCPGLIPGFFFFFFSFLALFRRAAHCKCQVFFFPPFSGGLPRVNTRVFVLLLLLLFSALFRRVRCVGAGPAHG